ncbi:MAG TPA: hypothetical protein VFT64_08055 [Rickettsiales bacterium]|nr:hypothetical protein [Rickettsiales bacterium]
MVSSISDSLGRPVVNIDDISSYQAQTPVRLGPLKQEFLGERLGLSPRMRDVITAVEIVNNDGITHANADRIAGLLRETVPVDFFVLECGSWEGINRLAGLVEQLPDDPEFASLRNVIEQIRLNTQTEGRGLDQPVPSQITSSLRPQPMLFEPLMHRIGEEGITNENMTVVIASIERLSFADFRTTNFLERLARRVENLPQYMGGRGRLKNLIDALQTIGPEEGGALIPAAEAVEILSQRHRGNSWSSRTGPSGSGGIER